MELSSVDFCFRRVSLFRFFRAVPSAFQVEDVNRESTGLRSSSLSGGGSPGTGVTGICAFYG
jgi:hypothetical protein